MRATKDTRAKWHDALLLGFVGMVVAVAVAAFQDAPGYMDADYYFATGSQIASGRGCTEPFVWNYLDDPVRLPHPAFSYWMPLASLLVAAGASLGGSGSWFWARIPFVLVAAALPLVTYALAWSVTARRRLALTSGMLAAFPCAYLPYLSTTDTVAVSMLLGAGFFLLLGRPPTIARATLLGATAGLLHLARVDGLLWLFVAWVAMLMTGARRRRTVLCVGVLLGYLLVMGPWIVRNFLVLHSAFAPGGSRGLWLASYDELFSYPPQRLAPSSWYRSGIGSILAVRLDALAANLGSLVVNQGAGFVLPLILMGLVGLRRDARVQLAILGATLLLFGTSFVFPFASARGGYFHAAAVLQPFWWAVAPVGLERLADWTRSRPRWDMAHLRPHLRVALVAIAALLSMGAFHKSLLSAGGRSTAGWAEEQATYRRIQAHLVSKGCRPTDVVMVANPPGYYLASHHAAIAVPYASVEQTLMAARRFHARYLVLEYASVPAPLRAVYAEPCAHRCLSCLGEVARARLYEFSCSD